MLDFLVNLVKLGSCSRALCFGFSLSLRICLNRSILYWKRKSVGLKLSEHQKYLKINPISFFRKGTISGPKSPGDMTKFIHELVLPSDICIIRFPFIPPTIYHKLTEKQIPVISTCLIIVINICFFYLYYWSSVINIFQSHKMTRWSH